MKHILIISGVFPPEPVTSAYLNYDLAYALKDKYNVTVLRPKPTRPIGADYSSHEHSYDTPFKCIELDSYTHPQSDVIGRLRETISFGLVCTKYIKEHHDEIDFIYNSSWQLFGYYLVAKAAKKYSIPYIVPIQDIYPESVISTTGHLLFLKKMISKVLMRFDIYYQKNAYRIRTITNEMADYLSKTRSIERSRYLVVNNWQEDSQYNVESTPHSERVFAFVGSINLTANVELMIQAFAKANLKRSVLRIYGGGPLKERCMELVKSLGLKNVVFNSVPREQVPTEQANADVLLFALPENYAGLCLPSKITSYMLSGKAIMASVDNPSAASRYVLEAGCGIVVKPDSLEELTEGFKYFEKMSDDQIFQLGLLSKAYAASHLSKETNLTLVVNEIEKALNQ